MEIVTNPQLRTRPLGTEFSPEDKRVASTIQHVAGREAVAVVSAYGLNSNLE